jgi:hypothetical protein
LRWFKGGKAGPGRQTDRVGNLRPPRVKSRKANGSRALETAGIQSRVPGVVLAPCLTEHHVFRATLVSIVLTLAVGQDVTLLCRVWCDAPLAAASGCHYEDTIDVPSVTGDRSCDYVLGASAFLREEARRTVAGPDAAPALVVSRAQIAQLTIGARPDWEPTREWSLTRQPVSTALRI